jgi:hypothetical protein
MTVRELVAILQGLDPNMPVAYCLHSDYAWMQADALGVAKAVNHGNGGYLERLDSGGPHITHVPGRYPADKLVDVLVFPGN